MKFAIARVAQHAWLVLGANIAGVNLVTRWAVDLNEYACQSLKENHPETVQSRSSDAIFGEDDEVDEDIEEEAKTPSGEFEVGKLVGICFGDPNEIGVQGLRFKVRWKGYGPSEDMWEPIDGLRYTNGTYIFYFQSAELLLHVNAHFLK
ncbi:hypothetical protein MRB53_028361 [Persea americana]|uniref:Uncharacterized protein n=1 Tax=Persea americana TaxID=3435 RepID=A0ACC2KFS4_PERAE|nr:hypothetical protein MRB53_028361 [Persea americana]